MYVRVQMKANTPRHPALLPSPVVTGGGYAYVLGLQLHSSFTLGARMLASSPIMAEGVRARLRK